MDTLEKAIKTIMLQCLDDPEVIEKIKINLKNDDKLIIHPRKLLQKSDENCFGEIEIKSNQIHKILENQKLMIGMLKDLPRDNPEKKSIQEMEGLKEEYKKELIEKDEKITSKNQEIKDKNQEICNLKSKYLLCEEIVNIWNDINLLCKDHKDYIDQLCGGGDILAIISLGRDKGKIDQLWNYLKDLAVKGQLENEQISILNRYFEFCMKVHNSANVEGNQYSFVDVEVGSEFDANQSIKTANSKQVGNVKEIIVKRVMFGGKIKFKEIVTVE